MDLSRSPSSALNQQRRRPVIVRITHKIEDSVDDINWIHIAFKLCAYTYIAFMAWITWQVLPLSGHWSTGRQVDRLTTTIQDFTNYFGSFEGFSECNIRALDLYSPPLRDESGNYGRHTFCPNRKALLGAMSNGGRIGFDAPYISKGCHYKWYSVSEICMVLERFDGIVFVGDDTLRTIYSGFNILLRQDLANGALQTWNMDSKLKGECRCNNQFTKSSCSQYYIEASEQVSQNIQGSDKALGTRFVCERSPHAFLNIGISKPAQAIVDRFEHLVSRASKSNYKPIPVIYSLSPAAGSHKDASGSLVEFHRLADLSDRKTPMLWVGPAAAGHIEIRGRKTNQEIWDFDDALSKTAVDHGIEVLKMWNMTVQATSWDGIRFGENVALVQAMMLMNWLSRLESS